MHPTYDSHILRWKNVNWSADETGLLESIRSRQGREVLARIRQAGSTLEVPDPARDFSRRLQQGGVNLGANFELEIITREPELKRVNGVKQPEQPADDYVDRNDFNSLQWNGERGTGAMQSSRVRNTPMFFRNNGMNADLVDLYAGQTLFLVLNGGSLAGFDWSRLKKPGICTFGINNGAHMLRPTFWTSVDDPTRFMRSIWADPAITKFVPMSHFQKPIWDPVKETFSDQRVKDFPNIYGYRRNEAFQATQWLFEDTINWGNHGKRGGGRSVMLAALRIAFLLGFRRVCLLGCDFYMDEANRYWFAEGRSKQAISNNQNSYRLMMGFFEQLQPHFLEAGFHVVNCNPKSQLKAFPMADLDEELRAAEVDTSATTEGMYTDRYKAQKEAARKPAQPPRTAQAKPARPAARQAVRSPAQVEAPAVRPNAAMLEHMISAVQQASLQQEPFDHLLPQAVFSEAAYQDILGRLPEDRHYHELRHADAIQPDGRSARLRFGFSGREIGALPVDSQTFWSQMRAVLLDRRLENAFRNVFKEGLKQRFGKGADRVVLRPVPELVRDLKGYRIGVHPDIQKKVISVQFYLPSDEAQRELGTSYFRREGEGGFALVKKLEFAPSTGHAFVVTRSSFHGVPEPMPEHCRRNSLMLTYYLKDK